MVLIILPCWDNSFINKNIGSLIKSFEKTEEIIILLRDGSNKHLFSQEYSNIRFYSYGNSILKLLTFLVRNKSKIELVFWSYIGYWENLLFSALRIKYVLKSDSFNDFNPSLSRRIKTFIDKKSQLIITETERNKTTLIDNGFDNIVILPNSFEYKPQKKSVDYDPYHLVSIGRFHPDKGIERTIEFLTALPKYKFTFIGEIVDDKYFHDFLNEIKKKGIDDRVNILPSILLKQNLIESLREYGWLLNLSRVEGSPNRFIDAFAAGIPILTLDVGYCRDLVIDNQNGLIASTSKTLINLLANESFNYNQLKRGSSSSFKSYNKCMSTEIHKIYENMHNF